MMDDSFCFGFSFSFFIVTTVTNTGSFQYLFRDIAGRLLRPVALSTLEARNIPRSMFQQPVLRLNITSSYRVLLLLIVFCYERSKYQHDPLKINILDSKKEKKEKNI